MVIRLEHNRYLVVWYQVGQWYAHSEFMVFSLAFNIILSTLWLKAAGLYIDWSNGAVAL